VQTVQEVEQQRDADETNDEGQPDGGGFH
jgi:hypothetical protein